jgi:ADP-ribose pyrophosphatase
MDRAERAALSALEAAHAKGKVAASVDREWVMVGVLAEDAWGVVLRDAVRTPQGELRVYRREMTAPNRPAGVVALTTLDGRFVLLNHYRHALRKFGWEFPRGFARPGEDAEATLQRQLSEEIQAVATAYRHAGMLEPDGGKLGDSIHLLDATIDALGQPEAGEAIAETELVTISELRARVRSNEITDALTLAAVAKLLCSDDAPK